MTIRADLPSVDAGQLPPPRQPWSRRRRIVTLVAAVVGVALVAAGVAAAVYVNRYQPLGAAGFGQDSPEMRQNVRIVSDHLGNNTYVVIGKPNTIATVDYTIANNGPFDITVLGLQADGLLARGRLEWGPATVPGPAGGGTNPTYPRDARPFPATLKAHEAIQLFVSIRKPGCAPFGVSTIYGVPIRWQALGVHHVTELPLSTDSDFLPIAVCAPPAALRNATLGRS